MSPYEIKGSIPLVGTMSLKLKNNFSILQESVQDHTSDFSRKPKSEDFLVTVLVTVQTKVTKGNPCLVTAIWFAKLPLAPTSFAAIFPKTSQNTLTVDKSLDYR